GATLAPVILATNKTQLTQFSGNKSAYPPRIWGVSLGSLEMGPGTRACVLLAYLSVDKPGKKGLTKREMKLRRYQLFHRSMSIILEPLKRAGNPLGRGIEMVGGNGCVRR
ncbi:hypothetical protein EV360DRAFT_54735, partial [Lentinula raphanica]